jgi:hypothetical protein
MASKPSASGTDLAKRALDAEAGLGGNPARILELVADEAVSAGWERLNGRHGRGLCLDWERFEDYAVSCFCHPGGGRAP